MYEYDYRPYMQMASMPSQYSPMMEMPQEQLESMYPESYHVVYPKVKLHIDMMVSNFGTEYTPTRKQLEDAVRDIYAKVEVDLDVMFGQEPQESGERQFGFGFGRRRFARDLISILLIRELLGRRRPFPYPYPYPYPFPYGGGFGYYPFY